MPWVRRPRRQPRGEPVPEAPAVEQPAEAVGGIDPMARVPPPSRMRRERRDLARRREIEIRDVGGLAVEMVRRDRFKPDLLLSRANDVLSIEERMHELDGFLIAVAAAPRGLRALPTCRCGAPLLPGSHFCSNCGRPSNTAPPVLTCSHCGQPLPAETNFCAFCGNAISAEELSPGENIEDTIVRRWSAGEES